MNQPLKQIEIKFMPAVLITGENSFIGNSFIRFSENKNVRTVSLFDNSPESVDFTGIDVVLHLAAIVHVKEPDPKEYYRVNRDLTLRLAECARSAGVRHFIFMSTIKVYGEYQADSLPWNEISDCNPADHYGKSKYEAELELNKLAGDNFHISIIRTPIVYGKGMKANMLKLVKLVKYCPILPFGKIENERHYTYIENLIGVIDRIIRKGIKGTFIAMDECQVSTTDLVLYLSESLRRKTYLFRLPSFLLKLGKYIFPATIDRLYGSFKLDNTQTRNLLDYDTPYSTRAGIHRMIDSSGNNF